MPAEPSEGPSAFRVYLGDSLQTATHGSLVFGHSSDTMLLTTPQGRQASIPMAFVESPSFAESLRRMVNAATHGHPLPADLNNGEFGGELEACQRQLRDIVSKEGNSVWTWYAVNLAGPHLLAERKINRIVANPPWVPLSQIQVEERKRDMEGMARSLGLGAGGKQSPHPDIASFFILRARALYAANPDADPAAWLVKRSALGSGQWRPFREIHKGTLAQSVDLDDLNPFDGGDATRCCILMEHRALRETSVMRVQASRTGGPRPAAHESLAVARGKFKFVDVPEPLPQEESAYSDAGFRQGATIVPHVLAIIAGKRAASRTGWTRVRTRPSMHRPWSQVASQEGEIPSAWARKMHVSRDLLPYLAAREPPEAIIPVGRDGELHLDPGRACAFWRELDELYDAHKGLGTNTPATLLNRFDYSRALSSQPLMPQRGRRMLLYPSSGNIMRAARTGAGGGVVDASVYWLTTRNEAEAGFLVALLNAECLQRAFAECRESGRHFHLHPWRKVPIPRYDGKKQRHRRLAELCSAAERIARKQVEAELEARPHLKQPGLSAAIREAVLESKAGREIERIAKRLLPDQAV